MIIGVIRETFPGEKRVALTPASISVLRKAGFEIFIETNAGDAAGFPDNLYQEKGATIVKEHDMIFSACSIILHVHPFVSYPNTVESDLLLFHQDHILLSLLDPLSSPEVVRHLAERGITSFALELMPRITRAQSMDVLSSMATIAGYKAVILAADVLPKIFPMLMTAAGTIAPARVFVVGAGVAGLQAIATAHRLGAIVYAYDVRPGVKEQVESLGAKFVELPLEVHDAEEKTGYAKQMDETFYRKQREHMAKVVSETDVIITTAAIPGKKAPILITEAMINSMKPGSVIVDLAADSGGNCSLTRPGETYVKNGISIMGPLNLPASVPNHASQMYANNISNFLLYLLKGGMAKFDETDEIIRETMVTRSGTIVNPRVRLLMGLSSTEKNRMGV